MFSVVSMQWFQCSGFNAVASMQWFQCSGFNEVVSMQWFQCNDFNASDLERMCVISSHIFFAGKFSEVRVAHAQCGWVHRENRLT